MTDEPLDLDEELEQLLDGEFDLDAFLAEIREESGVSVNATAVDVPIAYFLRAQQAGLLGGLEIALDNSGCPFLLALVPTGDGGQILLISSSFTEVDPDEEEES